MVHIDDVVQCTLLQLLLQLQGQHICVVAVGVKKWGAEQRRLLGDNYNH